MNIVNCIQDILLWLKLNVTFEVALSLVVVVSVFIVYRSQRKALPRPSGLPLLGNLLDIVPDKLLGSLDRFVALHGKTFDLIAAGSRFVVFSDVSMCKEIMAQRPKTFRRPKSFEYAASVLGFQAGVFHANGTVWSRVRRITAPSFSKRNVHSKILQIFDESCLFAELIENSADGKTVVDMKSESFKFTLRVMTKVALGLDLSEEARDYFFSEQFAADVNALFIFHIENALFPLPPWVWRLTPMYKLEVVATEGNARFDKYCLQIIRDRREYIADTIDKRGSQSMVDDIIRKNEHLHEASSSSDAPTHQAAASDAEILANVKTFFLAGSDTTKVSIVWMLYKLCLHPDVLEAVRLEADAFMEATKSASGPNKLQCIQDASSAQNFKMCNAVFKETLRQYAPGAFVMLELEDNLKSVTLSDNTTVYANDQIIAYTDGVMADPEIFGPDVKNFNPLRWLTADSAKLSRMEECFLAFGYGARICPGMQLASIEAVISVAVLVSRFDFRLACDAAEIERKLEFVATINKLPLYVSKRKLQ